MGVEADWHLSADLHRHLFQVNPGKTVRPQARDHQPKCPTTGVDVLRGTRRAAVGTFPVWFAFVIMLLRGGEGFPLRVAQFTSRLNTLSINNS